jgi:hypothetical protein
MHFTDKDDVVRGLICSNYNIFVVYSEQGFWTSGSLNTYVAFVLIDLLRFPIRIWINVLTALKGYQPALFLVLSIFWHIPSQSPQ